MILMFIKYKTYKRWREGEIENKRDRVIERKRDIEKERQREREIERNIDRKKEIQRERRTKKKNMMRKREKETIYINILLIIRIFR